ncbi:uncharacterized protein LOC123883604 isoform X2 [Trifolium pratense]|uniref:uncharacterized protein LOC123883604 isoform X2 n=1 Tax=Trifolium pratense TaxID=57577 RepID=UPI001E6902A9|nr:uncharacterized protein LOC123883604 isoform X2 [Trifolium pratense]
MSIPFFSFVLLDSLSGRKLFIFVSPRLSICHRRLLLEFVCLVSNLFWLYTRFLLPLLSFYLALSLFIIVSVLICFFFCFLSMADRFDFLCDAFPGRTAWRFKGLILFVCLFHFKLGIQTHFYMDRSISCFLCSL